MPRDADHDEPLLVHAGLDVFRPHRRQPDLPSAEKKTHHQAAHGGRHARRLAFPDPVAVAKDYFQRTGLFPIMHVVGVRHTLAVQYPWLPGAILKAIEQAKEVGLRELSDTSAPKVTFPFIEERLEEVRASMGKDFGRTAWIATASARLLP